MTLLKFQKPLTPENIWTRFSATKFWEPQTKRPHFCGVFLSRSDQRFFEGLRSFLAMSWLFSRRKTEAVYDSKRSKLFALPPPVWGQITALLTAEELVRFGIASPFARHFLRMPHVVTSLHIQVPVRSNIKLDTFPHEWYASYPTLTSIGLTFRKQGQKGLLLTPPVLAQLPASLRHLHLTFPDTFNDQLIGHLPHFLLTLNLELNTAISDDGIQYLPEGLETLHLPHNPNLTSFCIPKLPRSLKTLTFQTKEEIPEGAMRQMPALTSLTITGDSRVPGPSIAALPSSLTAFKWAISQPMDAFAVQLLSPNLRDFSVSKLNNPDDAVEKLPRELQRLLITAPNPDLSIHGFRVLPPKLVYLEISQQKTLATGSILSLPRQLHSLSLPLCRTLLMDDLKSLPQSLYILKMKSVAHLTNEWFALLPPRIHFFSCTWNVDISEKLLEHVTPSLARLELRAHVQRVDSYSPQRVYPQPIDEAMPSVLALPRRSDDNTHTHGAPFETFLFEINAPKGLITALDVYPKSALPVKTQPQTWFEKLFS